MPENKTGGEIDAESRRDISQPHGVHSPPSLRGPNLTKTQGISEQDMEREVKDLDDRVRRAEKWMIALTAVIALFTFALVGVGTMQWSVMRGQLNEMKSGGTDTHDLAVAAKAQSDNIATLAGATKQQADDISRILRGTQTALMAFSVGGDIFRAQVDFTGNNMGKIEAKNVKADLNIMIRDWPSKAMRLGPIPHQIRASRVGIQSGVRDSGMGQDYRIEDHFTVPRVTPEIFDDLKNGRAYLTVQWSAAYDDGFGSIIPWPMSKEASCDAWMFIGYVRCRVFDGGFGDHSTCNGVDSLRSTLETRMQDAKKQYCPAN